MRYHNCGTLTLESTRAGLAHTIRMAGEIRPFVTRAIVLKSTNENVGVCHLGPCTVLEGHPVEISYDIVRRCWGNGYATEAAARLLRHGFDGLHLPEVLAFIHPQNTASARVAEKLGFAPRGKAEWPKQGLVDLYALTSEDYTGRKMLRSTTRWSDGNSNPA